MTVTETAVNLCQIANKIALTSEAVRQKAREGEPVNIAAAKLTDKIPALKVLDEECAVVQVVARDKKIYGNTLSIFLDDSGYPRLFDAALNPVNQEVKYLQYRLGYGGYQRVEIKGQVFDVDIRLSDYYKEHEEVFKGQSGEGLPDSKLVRNLPVPGALPMKALEKGVAYKVLERQGQHFEYGTPRYLAEANGKPLAIYGNAELERLIESAGGLPVTFEIEGYVESEQGTIVKIRQPGEASFDDLEV